MTFQEAKNKKIKVMGLSYHGHHKKTQMIYCLWCMHSCTNLLNIKCLTHWICFGRNHLVTGRLIIHKYVIINWEPVQYLTKIFCTQWHMKYQLTHLHLLLLLNYKTYSPEKISNILFIYKDINYMTDKFDNQNICYWHVGISWKT